MSARAYALMTGLFIVVLGAAIAAAAYWFGGSHAETRPYVVIANQSVLGLHTQSTVYYRGVPAGKVTDIHLAPNNARKTRVQISISDTIPVTASTYATLHAKGVTGLVSLELEDSGASTRQLPTSAEQPATVRLKGGAQSLTSAGKQLAAKLNNIADTLRQILSDDNRQKINSILTNTARLTEKLSHLSDRLDSSLDRFPALAQSAHRTLGRANTLLSHLIGLTDSLDDLEGKLQGFADAGTTAGKQLSRQTLPELDKTLQELQQAADAITNLGNSLERNPQQLLFGPAGHGAGPGEPGFKDKSQGDQP